MTTWRKRKRSLDYCLNVHYAINFILDFIQDFIPWLLKILIQNSNYSQMKTNITRDFITQIMIYGIKPLFPIEK
jgi:hypothetical protein